MEIDKIIQIAKRRGIIFPSSEIYGGLAGFFDYGPVGCLIKRNLENFWREFFIYPEENFFEVETSLVMHEKVWEASGHLENFVDPITQCEKCKSFFRADNLIEEVTGKFVEGFQVEKLTEILRSENIRCPKCKGQLSDVKIFNLMFGTPVGPTEKKVAYLRPETAQGIFINFKNIINSTRAKLPFAVVQVGRSFRNEISPRQWIIRLREFNQIEIEYFFDPSNPSHPRFDEVKDRKIRILTREGQKEGKEAIEISVKDAVENKILPNQILAYFLAKEYEWYKQLGIPAECIRFREMLPEETPHYSKGNFDLEIKFDFGWKEVVGNAYRTDFDLKTHSKHSKEDLSIPKDGEKIIPHVVEPSFGIDRTIYAILLYCFRDGKERGWSWFNFPPKISPYVAGVFPLVKKDNLPEKAKEVYESLKGCYKVFYDDKGSIGKRYARADEIGVLVSVTIDYQTLKDDTVTIRDRNTTKQVRVKIEDLKSVLWKLLEGEKLEKLGTPVVE